MQVVKQTQSEHKKLDDCANGETQGLGRARRRDGLCPSGDREQID